MSEPIITSLRNRNLHKQPAVLAAAERTRKRTDSAGPDARDPEALIKNYIRRFTEILERKDVRAKRT